MATVAAPESTFRPSPGVVIHDLTWADYERMLRIVGDRPIRINFDRGSMEIMSPGFRHGNGAYLLSRMVDTLTEELAIEVEAADPVTLRRADLEKGVEPDKLYFLRANAPRVRGKWELDLTIDPPPDLIIEVDLTSSSVPRLPIFAALGIAEIWRVEAEELQFLHLQPDGTYQPGDRSRAFPIFAVADAARFLDEGLSAEKTVWIRRFRAWVRATLVPLGAEGPG